MKIEAISVIFYEIGKFYYLVTKNDKRKILYVEQGSVGTLSNRY